jgi:hypothetical protein
MPEPFARRERLSNLIGGLDVFIDERIDARNRDQRSASFGPGGSVLAGGGSVGGGGTGTDPVIEDGAHDTVATLSVADNASGYLDLGVASGIAAVWAQYWIRRNKATAAREVGRFAIAHDGATAQILSRQGAPFSAAAGLAGVTFSASIASGQLRLTATTDNLTPDATADLIFIFTILEALL